MSMPTWDEFMAPVLQVMSDRRVRRLRELRDATAESVRLDADQLAETLASGQSKSGNRIGWAASYLNRVGALERPARGQYVITDKGLRLLAEHPDGISESYLRTLARPGDEWWLNRSGGNSSTTAAEATPVAALDPVEQVEDGIGRLHADVAAQLLDRLHSQEPAFFEQAVLDLLIAMGYGGADGKATRTQLSNDGGIDGIVDQDALGLSRIYVQAKRYALDTSIGRPEIQAFVGALHGAQANQGVFITTGRFSGGATQYAESVASRIILIDGARLAALMIRYGVGVRAKRTLQLVEIDEDFFE